MIQRKDDPNAQQGDTAAEVVDELENLAAGVEQNATNEAGQEGQGGQDKPAQALPPQIVAAIAMVPIWLLRLLRERIARTMPEIRNHWTDAALNGPGEAAAPLIVRYLDRLAPFAAAYPEATMLVLACMPLGLGYVAAMEEHDAKQAKEVTPQGAAQVVASGDAPQMGRLSSHEPAVA